MSAAAPPGPDFISLREEGEIGAKTKHVVESCLSLSSLLAFVATVVPILGFLGWAFELPALGQIHPSLPAMQPNTAVGLSMGAVAIILFRSDIHGRSAVRSYVGCALATLVLLLGLLNLSQYMFGWELGLDRLIVREPPTPTDPYHGRPSPQTSASLALLGACLLFEFLPPRFIHIGQTGAVLIGANALVALTGYVFGVSAFYRFPLDVVLTGMSVPTALAFIMLSIALLCARPNEGLMSLIASGSHSGAIARRIVLILIVGPPLLGALTLMGRNAGWYGLGVQASLFVLMMLALLLWSTWQAARQGEQSELLTQAANAATNSARDELEVLATRVHTLLDQAPDGVFVANLDGRYTDVNSAGCRMLGYTREEILGKTIGDMIPPEDSGRLAQHRERLLRGGVEVGEWLARRKDGTCFPVEVSAKILPDGRWQAFVRDVSERKCIEREQTFLAEAGAELASTLDYEQVLESLAGLAVRGAADVCIVDILGADGKPYRRKTASRDPSKAWACEALARAPFEAPYLPREIFKGRQPIPLRDVTPEKIRSFARSKEVLEAWLELAPRSLIMIPLVAHGGVVAVMILASSTSWLIEAKDLRLAEELAYRAATALENALLYRELKQAIKAREDVLAIVSHDLRNPLTAIKSIAALLRSVDLTKAEKVEKYTNAIQASADQMKHLIEDLLDFSRVQSGGFSVKKLTERPIDLIAAAVDSMRNQADARKQTLSVEVADGLPDVSCDRKRIGQALSNLLGNAIKFTPEGGAITVTAHVQGDELVMTVSDTGPGIPAEHLPKIFDRYWQAEETKDMGAGLGLAIVKGIAETHGGRSWAESRLGAGSSFHLALPLDRPR